MKLEKLRSLMKESGIDYYVVPTDDFHGSEYVGEYFRTRAYLSGFTGSAGTLLVGSREAALWTDGRYFLQAAEELKDSGISLMKMGEEGVPTLMEYLAENLTEGMTLGFDGRCVSASFVEELKNELKETNIQIAYEKDLAGESWEERPALSRKPVWFLEEEECGLSRKEKIANVRTRMKEEGAEALLLTSLDEIAWLFNMRGNDIAYNPVVLSFCLITEKEVRLFIQRDACNAEQESALTMEGIMLDGYLNVYDHVKTLKVKNLWLNDQKTSYALLENLPKEIQLIKGLTPVAYAKALKNAKEQENMKIAHVKDGAAVTKFMCWLKNNVGKEEMTEISLQEKLKEFRKQQADFIEESFGPIAGYGPHGAIVHYSATEESDAKVEAAGLLLMDTGGQYLQGTTDITRTFVLGEVSAEVKKHFTTVLQGNLRLGAAKFKEGCTGENLDILARGPFWEQGLDYNHGTGHGVGYVLNVHELPGRIMWKRREGYGESETLQEGMILSNEPGFYLEGAYGIRLENLVLCKKAEKNAYGQFMEFETLTLVPFDLDGVDVTLLSGKEKKLLNDYHSRVYAELLPYMTKEEAAWLAQATRAV